MDILHVSLRHPNAHIQVVLQCGCFHDAHGSGVSGFLPSQVRTSLFRDVGHGPRKTIEIRQEHDQERCADRFSGEVEHSIHVHGFL